MTDHDPDRDDLLAAELAFGLLDADERRDAERRVRDDMAFAARFDWWQARSLALLDGHDESPPPTAWAAIARRLPANENAPSVGRWQAATALAASIALVLGATLLLRPEPAPAPDVRAPAPVPRTLVAVLASPDRADVVAVDYDPAARRLSARPTGLAIGAKDAELWVIPAGGAPVSLGVVATDRRTARAPAPQVAALLVPGSTLAISIEPRGGSPTGAPTGAVILTGKIAQS